MGGRVSTHDPSERLPDRRSSTRRQAETTLEEETRLRTALLDNIPGCIALILKKDTREIVASNKFARELGAVPGQTCFNTCAMRDDNCPFCLAPKLWATGRLQRIEVEYRGTWYEGIWAPFSEDSYVHYIFDISERKRAEEALRESEEKHRLLVENSHDIIYTITSDGTLTFVSPSWTALLGHRAAQVVGHSFRKFVHPDDHAVCAAWLQNVIETGRRQEGIEYRVRHMNGSWRWHTSHAVPLSDEAGTIIGLEGIASDITERKQADEALRRLSTHDALTDLYNRSFFMEEVARLERGRKFPVSIVMADVDHLKEMNDQLGHAAGDALLKRVAQVLTAAFRAEDVVARIGGDEFAVLLPATDATSANVSLQRVRQLIQENNADHTEAPIQISIGISTAESPASLSDVLKEADANMYREKRGHDATQ
jgi:diguanylate cyclase (GGDEF)-like protein/PAS domain S-box-containing protein